MSAREHVVQGQLQLRPGSLMRVADGAGLLVYVRRGRVWITEEGGLEDHVVEAGSAFRLAHPGTALVSALQSSLLSLSSPRESRAADRIALLRPGTARPEPLLA